MVARNAADVAGGQLDRLAGATPEARAAAAERVAALAALGDRLAADRPTLDALDQAARRAGEQAEAAAGQARQLAALAAPVGVDALAADLAEAADVRARCAARGEEAAAAVEAAEASLAELPERRGVEAQRTDHARRAELAEVQERGERAAAEAADALAAAAEAGDRARADLEARTAEREHARVEHRAQALVPELVVGEDCPVCGQQVRTLPAHEAPADLARAERLVDDATRAAESALATVTEARTHQARVDEKLDRVRSERAEVDERLANAPDAAAVEHTLALLDEAATALDKARQADRDARKELTAAADRVRALAEREAEARRAFDRARDEVAALAPPPAERRDLAADWAALLAWGAERAPALAAAEAEHRAAAEGARADAARRLGDLAAACAAAGVEVAPGAWPGEAVAATHARAEGDVARLDEQLAEAERLRAEGAAATGRQQVADALAGHLKADRFEKWLLDEALHQLVVGASDRLLELSGGAFSLALDGRWGGFAVVDHIHAAQVRSARTLSGGETFLASLALALALADQVAGLSAAGAARLDALFLDEGFGSLDPDTLDVVATALDELGARGRMVGVVTHVRELAERLPVRFEVSKTGGAAAIERVEA